MLLSVLYMESQRLRGFLVVSAGHGVHCLRHRLFPLPPAGGEEPAGVFHVVSACLRTVCTCVGCVWALVGVSGGHLNVTTTYRLSLGYATTFLIDIIYPKYEILRSIFNQYAFKCTVRAQPPLVAVGRNGPK